MRAVLYFFQKIYVIGTYYTLPTYSYYENICSTRPGRLLGVASSYAPNPILICNRYTYLVHQGGLLALLVTLGLRGWITDTDLEP